MGNWDEFVRTGGWDTGARPPIALGVEAAGVVETVGADVRGLRPGDAGTTHSLPAGSWAEKFIAAADHVAPVPSGVPTAVAAALPAAERGITLSDIVVVPDGARLARLVPLLAPDAVTVAASYPLAEAAAAMARLRQGTHGAAVVLEP